MSSAEALITEIVNAYGSLRETIDKTTAKSADDAKLQSDGYKPVGITRKQGLEIFERALGFQKFLEARESNLKVFQESPYYERTASKFSEILEMTRSKGILKNVFGQVQGLCVEARQLITYSTGTSGMITYQHKRLSDMQSILVAMEVELVELYSDIRLLQEMLILPASNRTRVKMDLIRGGFEESAKFLESAEQAMGLQPPRGKDVMTNCRMALEALLNAIMRNKSLEPTKWFAKDLVELAKADPELVDDGMQRLLRGAFDYLSVKGPHPHTEVDEKNLSEGTFGLNFAYLVISHVLSRFQSFAQERGKGKTRLQN